MPIAFFDRLELNGIDCLLQRRRGELAGWGGVVGDWSTAPRPIIVSAGAASEGERKKSMAAANCVVLGFPPYQSRAVAKVNDEQKSVAKVGNRRFPSVALPLTALR